MLKQKASQNSSNAQFGVSGCQDAQSGTFPDI